MKKVLKEICPYVIIVIVVLLIKSYIVTPIRVEGTSMAPNLKNGDIMILNRLAYVFNEIKRGDIVVVDHNQNYIIKRIIGLPGEYVAVKEGNLYINGKLYLEKYLSDVIVTEDFELYSLINEAVIPEDCYFVLGDNRDVSLDSRQLGLIPINEIQGKATFTIFPFSRFGIKK